MIVVVAHRRRLPKLLRLDAGRHGTAGDFPDKAHARPVLGVGAREDGVAHDLRELPAQLVGHVVVGEPRGGAERLRVRDLLQEGVALVELERVEPVPPGAARLDVVGARQRSAAAAKRA